MIAGHRAAEPARLLRRCHAFRGPRRRAKVGFERFARRAALLNANVGDRMRLAWKLDSTNEGWVAIGRGLDPHLDDRPGQLRLADPIDQHGIGSSVVRRPPNEEDVCVEGRQTGLVAAAIVPTVVDEETPEGRSLRGSQPWSRSSASVSKAGFLRRNRETSARIGFDWDAPSRYSNPGIRNSWRSVRVGATRQWAIEEREAE